MEGGLAYPSANRLQILNPTISDNLYETQHMIFDNFISERSLNLNQEIIAHSLELIQITLSYKSLPEYLLSKILDIILAL